MSRAADGFSLLEVLLALALGVAVLAGAGQLLVSAHQAWRLQGAAAQMQDDARWALQRLAEDLRMAGMFGCLRLEAIDFTDPAAAQAFARPVEIGTDSLTLVGAELPGLLGAPDWTVLTDCRSWAQVSPGQHMPAGDLLALPVRRVSYRLHNASLMLSTRSQHVSLIDNVRSLQLSRITSAQGERVDIRLTLHDRQLGLEQQHALSVALRNSGVGP
ncbi:pilus assembly protein PilW [Pantoea sp. Cy-639]|uniref:PilW family protein n=1 Tax=Pantoea sp. Cy-639 TaxID=2608360 RepID=UPI00141E9DD5|nr:pilus assembly protein PilW [Pantoea sp. Cy-639]NIF19960.1 pilus assembly protein PilW [Pantoea sp. Cy-639]